MGKIGIFFGPEKGSVGKIANLIVEKLGTIKADLHLVKDCDASIIDKYDKVILGISTIGTTNWDSEHTDTDWDVFQTHLKEVKWENKTVAIYGLGDQINYPEHFVDAIGWLYEKLNPLKANIVGFCNKDGYNFNESEAIVDGKFAGLPLDEDNESEKTEERLTAWLSELIENYNF
ncbi:flavodoxin [Plebeiibacterium marinum]|uniref:Flavodoxin n=1 Tax=Plebeiibacterium marinum TaxID=2992111 RepID=A0AAE3MEU6_9BACT|nr:flavodoxin [Plebeiobacterium marinum]MCW3806307.1 flavodoxin [Plebeiobacterium marinum]